MTKNNLSKTQSRLDGKLTRLKRFKVKSNCFCDAAA